MMTTGRVCTVFFKALFFGTALRSGSRMGTSLTRGMAFTMCSSSSPEDESSSKSSGGGGGAYGGGSL